MLCVPLPERRAAYRRVRAQERKLGDLEHVKTAGRVAWNMPHEIADPVLDQIVLAFRLRQRRLVDFKNQIAAGGCLDRLAPCLLGLYHLVSRPGPMRHAQRLFLGGSRSNSESDNPGSRKQDCRRVAQHRSPPLDFKSWLARSDRSANERQSLSSNRRLSKQERRRLTWTMTSHDLVALVLS